MGYHESNAKKIHFSKLDPSLGFAFLLRKEADYEKLRNFIDAGKRVHKKNWIFHAMESKPDFMKSRKPRTSSYSSNSSRERNKPRASSFEDINELEYDDGLEEVKSNSSQRDKSPSRLPADRRKQG